MGMVAPLANLDEFVAAHWQTQATQACSIGLSLGEAVAGLVKHGQAGLRDSIVLAVANPQLEEPAPCQLELDATGGHPRRDTLFRRYRSG